MNILIGAAAGALLIGAVPVLLQNKMIYFPRRYEPGLKPGGPGLEKFHPYTTTDGRKQWGWLIKPSRNPGEPSRRPDFYLCFNGNASSVMGGIDYYEALAKQTGCGFFLVDYRGYGFNDGRPNESGVTADALGAYDTMKAEGYLDNGAGLIGHSLGGGAAFAVAVSRPVERLITLSTFTSIDDMARRLIMWPIHYFCFNHFPNRERLVELKQRPEKERPREIILMHARQDEIIPFEMGEELAEVGGAGDPASGVEFIPLDKAGHNDAPEAAFKPLVDILNRPAD